VYPPPLIGGRSGIGAVDVDGPLLCVFGDPDDGELIGIPGSTTSDTFVE